MNLVEDSNMKQKQASVIDIHTNLIGITEMNTSKNYKNEKFTRINGSAVVISPSEDKLFIDLYTSNPNDWDAEKFKPEESVMLGLHTIDGLILYLTSVREDFVKRCNEAGITKIGDPKNDE